MTSIYLDIDGVLLTDIATPAQYADEFIQFVVSRYPDSTYWLTTHVWLGENVVGHSLAPYLSLEARALLGKIKPTQWDRWKTDAIDFSGPFLWFDDDLFPEERIVLERNNALSSWVGVDLYKSPLQLKELTSNFPVAT